MSTPWKQWKKRNAQRHKEGRSSPVDFINPETQYAPVEEIQRRIKICEGCEYFLKTKQCSQCGCFMPLKTRLSHAVCPMSKW